MSDNLQSAKPEPKLHDRRSIRKLLRIGHSYAVTVPGIWVKRNVDPDNPHVRTTIAPDGSYRVDRLAGTRSKT